MFGDDPHTEAFISVSNAATRLGVPAAWLRAEAKAGRVPHLLAGRRILLRPADVEAALAERAAAAAKPAKGKGAGRD